jgi:tetratricopeptide (TPR) repeat protein
MAVHPEPLPPDWIEALTDLAPEAVAQALEALERACLVKPFQDPQNGNVYVITYEIMRNACLLSLSQARQRILHLRMARVLEERNGVTPVSAQHLEDGGDLRQAFEAWLTVGKQAHNHTSIEQGYAACRKAEALFKRLSNGLPDREVYRLYFLWAGLAFQASDLETASELAAALLEQGQLRQSQLLIGSAYHLQAREALHTYQPVLALERVRMALGSLESCNFPSELIRVYVTRARTYLYLDRMEEADCSLQAALTAGQNCTDPEDMYALADAEYSLGVSSVFRGFSDRAERLARSSLAKAEQVGYLSGISRARMVLVRSFFLQNRCEDALEEYWNTVKLLPHQLTPFSACILETTAARCYLTLGDIDRAIPVLRKATDVRPELQSKEFYSDGFCVLGFLHHLLLDSPTAIFYHQKGLEFAHSFYWQMLNLYPLGIAQLETGQVKIGLENVSEAISKTRAANMPFLYQQAEILLATWMVRNGQLEAANEIERQISAEVEKSSLAVFPMRLIHLRALIALAKQDYVRANSILENQVRVAQQNSMIWFEIYGYRLLDRAEVAQDRPAAHQEEIKRLLSRLSIKCQDEEIRPVFERFRNKVQNPNED